MGHFLGHPVVKVTMNMAELGSQRSQQPANFNFEPTVREVFQKKWKFKMAFAMKGGRGSCVPLTYFEK